MFFLLFLVTAVLGDPTIISRSEWGARAPKSTTRLRINPPPFVVIHHSDGPTCSTTAKCERVVKGIQNYHMDNKKWSDIGYNFLVGGDGKVYEGRGWGKHGAHSPPYNSKSIGICFMGNFEATSPPNQQKQAAKDLIDYGVRNNLISNNYKLLGHRQAEQTDCPGDNLFGLIKTWPNFLNKK